MRTGTRVEGSLMDGRVDDYAVKYLKTSGGMVRMCLRAGRGGTDMPVILASRENGIVRNEGRECSEIRERVEKQGNRNVGKKGRGAKG